MADLYHFVTKEDSYANYFIHVSPRPGPIHPELGPECHSQGPVGLCAMVEGVSALKDPREGSASLTSTQGVPSPPQLLEIQADYHRRSLSSLDTALAELRENHGQAGGDVGPAIPHP